MRFFRPPWKQADEFIITDANGRPVPKTDEGKSLGPPLGAPALLPWAQWRHAGYVPDGLEPRGDVTYVVVHGEAEKHPLGTLDLHRYFCLTNPGSYKLTRLARVCFPDTNGSLRIVVLPPVTVPVRVVGQAR